MSGKQDKRLRREVRRYLHEAGATPEQLLKNALDMIHDRPRWIPLWLWIRLIKFVVKNPIEVSENQVRLVDPKTIPATPED